MTGPADRAPLVVLGLDAGDPGLLERWGRDGSLPAIGSIMERGCWGRTSGPEMISEHGMWVTLTSGVSRGVHGYYYHRQLVPGTYELAPARGRDLGVDPFWLRLDPGRKIAVIDVPDIGAPMARPGIQLSEWATHYPSFPPSSHPAELLDEVRRTEGRRRVVDEIPESSRADDLRVFRELVARARRKGELCRRLLARDRFDLVFIVFGETHTGGHQLWKYRGTRAGTPGVGGADELQGSLLALYREVDRQIAALLSIVPGGANVVLLSSVGLKSQYPAAGLGEAFCRVLGYQAAPASGPGRLRPRALLRRLLPQRVRDQLSRVLPRETQERLLSEKYRSSTDWSRTTAFAIPSYYMSFLRVNLRGREPQGQVAPGRDYDEILARLEADARLLVDPVTGAPAVRDVVRAKDLFGEGALERLPDLFVEWADADHFLERVTHPRAELRQTKCEFHRDSDHSRHGFVAAAGPAIGRRGNLGDVSPLDLVPTFLALCGAGGHGDLPGHPIPALAGDR